MKARGAGKRRLALVSMILQAKACATGRWSSLGLNLATRNHPEEGTLVGFCGLLECINPAEFCKACNSSLAVIYSGSPMPLRAQWGGSLHKL